MLSSTAACCCWHIVFTCVAASSFSVLSSQAQTKPKQHLLLAKTPTFYCFQFPVKFERLGQIGRENSLREQEKEQNGSGVNSCVSLKRFMVWLAHSAAPPHRPSRHEIEFEFGYSLTFSGKYASIHLLIRIQINGATFPMNKAHSSMTHMDRLCMTQQNALSQTNAAQRGVKAQSTLPDSACYCW